jgi:hypothetical protein
MNFNYLNYLTNKARSFDLSQDTSQTEKQVKLLFDKSDLLCDSQRDDLHIYNDIELLGKD